jgi:anti-anti-sigma regulatory factor
MQTVGVAAKKAGVAFITWTPSPQVAKTLESYGFTVFVIGSEHSWMLAGARAAVAEMKG